MTEDEMVGWHHQLDGHESEQAPGKMGYKAVEKTFNINSTFGPELIKNIDRVHWWVKKFWKGDEP